MENTSHSKSAIVTAISWTSLIIGLACVGFLAWYIPTDRREYALTFQDFDMQLPGLTNVMFAIPDLVFPATAIVCAIVMVVVQSQVRANVAALFHMLVIALSCVVLVVYRESLFQPLSMLIRGLNGG
jgi:cytochrome bd-type quinol oxidase subunit 2